MVLVMTLSVDVEPLLTSIVRGLLGVLLLRGPCSDTGGMVCFLAEMISVFCGRKNLVTLIVRLSNLLLPFCRLRTRSRGWFSPLNVLWNLDTAACLK